MTPDRWRQIEDLYNAAQKRHPDERAALLKCTDPKIRARVERMLEVKSSGQILDQSLDGILADPTKPAVAAGAQLGPYKIEFPIGSGGMGTVYRAIDTRLGRVVAIKTASERYSERSQLEARVISTLNHPHVCTLYDVGPNYLVMEFIEGSTLAAELQKGPLAPERVARYGAQIAEALAEAHALGIVHRDLKPANLMVTRHGVKVLDFGLAKTTPEAKSQCEPGITETGAVMGTPAYMAPEQAEGREPGSVTDLFSLGLVLYEMAVGKLPFPGASLGQMLASGSQPAVPPPSRAGAGVPASLDGLVAKLLQKDPAERPQSAAGVARELSTLADRLAAPPSRVRSLFRPAAAVLLLVLATGGTWLYRRSDRPLAQQDAASTGSLSYTQLTSFTDSAVGPALSPDGRMLAFYRSDNSFLTPDEIWVKLLPNGEPVQVTHDARPKYNVAFSPDSTRIAYTVFGNNLFSTYTVSSLGGDSELLLPNAAGLSWLNEGQYLFSQVKTGVHMGIVTARPGRSELHEIYFPVLDRGMAHYSYLSPDRKWVLLAEMDPQWGPCRLVPFAGGSLGRQVGPAGACTSTAWSPDGKWMYFGARVSGRRHLWRQRFPDGQPERITSGATEEDGIAITPDGGSLITSIFTRQNTVWIHDAHGDRALSSQGYAEGTPPVFSSDGRHLYYLLRRDSPESPAELWRADLVSGKSELVVPGVSMREYDIANDEKEVAFSIQPAGQPSQLWMAPLDRSGPPRRIAAGGESDPHFGPNNEVLFRFTDGTAYYLGSVKRDGTGLRKVLPGRVLGIHGISPDRRFIIIDAVVPGDPNHISPPTLAVPLDGGPVQRICDGLCTATWSPDGRYFYVETATASRENPIGRTAAIPVPPGKTLPSIPPATVRQPAEWARIPGVEIVEHDAIAPGPNPSTYAYVKPSVHANLFRIPLPQGARLQ
jgi:serine/threonine protein kinase